jgi:GTP:adenosylcobinamide-phosphate guanylyltransferase
MGIPAVVMAGDRGAAKAVYGESKVFLEIEGRPLVAHVVELLQQVPEVSEVLVVGDAERLSAVLGHPETRAAIRKPLHLMPQLRNLYENAWNAYLRLLPGGGAQGREPIETDADARMLYLSGDLPFATPQEVSAFIHAAERLDCDYALGLVTEESMRDFLPAAPGVPGIRMAAFNLREGRFRQSNLHLVKPGRLGNRLYIEEMYRHRHQKQIGQVLGLAARLLFVRGGLAAIWYYALMHTASFLAWHGWQGLADRVRRWIPMARIERGCSDLLRTRFRFAVTEVGGCAVDIDTEPDFDAAVARADEWREAQARRAAALHGPLASLPTGETRRG